MGLNLNKPYIDPMPNPPRFLMEKIEEEMIVIQNKLGARAAAVYEDGAKAMYQLLFIHFAAGLSVGQTMTEANEYMISREVKTADAHAWKSGFTYGQEFRNTINSTTLARLKDTIKHFNITFAFIERLSAMNEKATQGEELQLTKDALLDAASQVGVQNIVRKVFKL